MLKVVPDELKNPATFGLGLLLHSEGIEGGRKAYSGSWAGLFNSYYWVDRDSQTYGVFGTQILPFFDAASVNTLLQLEQAVYAQEPLQARVSQRAVTSQCA